MKELLFWLNSNSIPFKKRGAIIKINDFGKLLFIKGEDGILISDNFDFLMSEEEFDILEEQDIKYLCFKWGSKFYYSELVPKKNEYNEDVFEPRFNDLLDIGRYKSDLEKLNFVNLGVHTGYELLNGSGEPQNWAKKAKFYNHDTIGICEKNTLAGTLPLQLACKKQGIKCVLGQTISVTPNYDEEKEFQDLFDLKLYVKNEIGWRNLLNISKHINVDFDNFITEELLFSRAEGLIVVFTSDSEFNSKYPNKKEALKVLSKYKKHFDKKDIFYQIDSTEFEDGDFDLQNLKNIKFYIDNFSNLISPVLISDSFYVNRGDSDVKDYLNKIDKKAQPSSSEQHYKDVDEIFNKLTPLFEKNFEKIDIVIKAAKNTRKIANKCTYQIDTGNHKLPKFEVPNAERLYDKQILKGLKKKVLEKFKGDNEKINIYLDRIDVENDVIKGAGFIDYFLILWDIVRWAGKEGILVGPARGSAGGSLVAYLLGITEIDPIEYNLLFERFLNKARVSGERAKSADALPDIDVDFEGSRRQDVKRYIEEKYGYDFVCSIGTYTRLKPRSIIKDFGRVKGLTFDDVNYATKDIPDSHNPVWGDIFDNASKKGNLKKFVQNNADICEVIKSPLGQPKTSSIHPSAVLIVPKEDSQGNPMKIYDWMPVKIMDGVLVSEWEGKYIDAAGFLKEDILGIKQLDKFKYILDLIKKNIGKKVNLNKIPINKREVLDYFKKGWNEDVFQFGTRGLKSYSKKVKPDHIEDLISMNALFRPGPMDSNAHEDFVKIKHGKKEPEFDYMLDVVTKNTFGLYVYQEQIMQAVNVLGKLTLAEADELRTAIKKFDKIKMAAAQEKFLNGAIENGCDKDDAIRIWDKLNAFSAYGFNRSHSAAYSLMGYWCQYLKVKYPLEFWTASLNFADEKDDMPDRLSELGELDNGISIKQPDVNKSNFKFMSDPSNSSIYWSLTKIKGVGEVAAKMILEERNQNGEFFDLQDFISRVPKNKVNKRVVRALIMAGGFDEIGGEEGMEISQKKERKTIMENHCSLIKDVMPEDISDDSSSDSNWFWSVKQKELTGFGFIDFLPLVRKKCANLKKYPYINANDFNSENFKSGLPWSADDGGKPLTIAGRIVRLRERKTKTGNWMVRIELESNNVNMTLGIFGEIYDKMQETLLNLEKTKGLLSFSGYALKSKPYKGTPGKNEMWGTEKSKLVVLSK